MESEKDLSKNNSMGRRGCEKGCIVSAGSEA